ncbi:hypothetical protein QOZ80_7AG0561550 [Eleusine coracana subsp. coracana]|nr:hypothetical protein QOZ80_7AG0561550 [Eleusine coracana subsp. coracana]
MGGRRGSNRKEARTAAAGDRITDLPLELRARIASFLHYGEVVQLSALSRPWRHIHHHAPVVKIYLFDFLHLPDLFFDEEHSVPGLLDEDSILAVRVALGRRAHDGSASKVDTLRLAFSADDPRMRRHAGRIIALADAPQIHVHSPYGGHAVREAWVLDLPPAARRLHLVAIDHVVPTIAGPGAAALRKLKLDMVVLRDWLHLPALRSLVLNSVTVEAPFAPGQWCPLLEELDLFCCKIEQARVDIHLQHLKCLEMDSVDVSPERQHDGPPYGIITIDAPELLELDMIFDPGCTRDFKSFSLRAPKLRLLCWRNQFAERVRIDVGRPGSVKVGTIEFISVYFREIKYYREQMMRMLQGLLPDVPPESVADIARPYLTLEECPDSDEDDDTVEEKLTCNLKALMSCGT